MIEMQVRVDDDVDVLRRNATRRQILEQFRRLPIELDHPVRELVAHSGLNQHRLLSGTNQQRVESGGYIVLLVDRHPARPHHLGHDAKKCSAIQRISPIRKNAEFKVSKRDPLHETSVPYKHPQPRMGAIGADCHASNS